MIDVKSGKEDVKNTANDLYQREKKVGGDAFEMIKDKAGLVTEKLTETACDLYKQGKSKIHSFEETMVDYTDEVIKTVKEKPLSSILIAAGIGYIFSLVVEK
ncbi:MAG: hypothetical protein H0U75_08160 [Legionella sp.]|nr:hypothetical protein [Legionella sp.]